FSVLPVEILGSAYEQFLGKVIRITPAHHAKIEEKPEVRKAGGVYYTPQYIVEYIVKNTVGKLIDGKTPKEISNIKIVDPACGSGSFLIGAYQYLLDWHKNYYTDNGKISKGKKDNPLTPDGNLTTSEKKRILLNNIFGVDIDVNAVEVTKLSLLLKCLEGETDASIKQQFRLWNDRVLPTLENNIKSGNSLIDTDFYDTQIDFGEEKKIKPFSWQKGFPEVFNQGGFDVVISNPPWGAQLTDDELSYLRLKHNSVIVRMIDSYMYFINHSIQLLKIDGSFGMIIPSTFLNQSDMHLIRKLIVEKFEPQIVINLGEKVFGPKVLNTSTILVFKKSSLKISKIIIGDIRELNTVEKRLILDTLYTVDNKAWIEIVKADPLSTYY
ncbi:MAG: N-6 DNA methylase, partial [Bacteroidales bacterium]|nr:N-6 DNA methylase [Bacteroidales bacterium]